MKRLFCVGAALLTCGVALAAEKPAIYDADPEHLWNRLYRAIATRTEGGVLYGADNAVAFVKPLDDPDHVVAVANEFVATKGETRASGALHRALLQHDVWAAFDTAVVRAQQEVTRPLARVMGRLLMNEQSIAQLPDNYAAAVQAKAFATDFDAAHPEQAFLSPDLFDPQGPWIEIGNDGAAIAPVHLQASFGRSAFRIFIRCPGGRSATLAYLDSLNLFPTPWILNKDPIGIEYGATEKPVRMSPLMLNPATPQFPQGTIVALVRQMSVINEQLQPVATHITQSVQFRVFTKVSNIQSAEPRAIFAESQRVFKIVMRRRDALAGRSGGLHALRAEDKEPDLVTPGRLEWNRAQQLQGPIVLSGCVLCHSPLGIFSIGSFVRDVNPTWRAARDDNEQWDAAIRFKQGRFDWGMLRGLLAD